MSEYCGVTVHHDSGVEAAFADLVLPNRFACLRFDCMDHTVAGALNQQARSVYVCNDRRRVGCVVRPATGSAYLNCLAGLFVERHEAMCAASVLAPLKGDATDDY